MALDRPVHAPETADGTSRRAVAVPGAALRGGLAKTLVQRFRLLLVSHTPQSRYAGHYNQTEPSGGSRQTPGWQTC